MLQTLTFRLSDHSNHNETGGETRLFQKVEKMSKRHRNKYEGNNDGNFAGIVKKLEERNVSQERVTLEQSNGVQNRTINQIPLRTFPLMIGIPMDEVMYSKFFMMFMRNLHIMPWDALTLTESTYLPEARNRVHNSFLAEKQYSHLFMIDSDVIAPPSTIERLLNHKLPVVAGWYRNKHPTLPNHPVVYDFLSEDDKGVAYWKHREEAGEGLEKVDGIGAGCILMSREVAEALGKDPYDMHHGGEDLVLCRKLMKLGIQMNLDWSINCAHLGIRWT